MVGEAVQGSIPLSMIKESEVALRPVNRETEKYLQLVESIRLRGVLNSIVVREVKDPVTGAVHYGLIDGLHRRTAAGDAGLETIPANIIKCDDAELMEAQIITNIHKIETKPVEYSKQLIRILTANPVLTQRELAAKLGQSDAWIGQRLNLVKLDEKIAELVNAGQINLSNGYGLSKLPVEEQASFVDRAMTDKPAEFLPAVNARVKELRDAKHQGREPGAATFEPQAFLQKMSDFKSEMDSPKVGPALIALNGASTAAEGFVLAIQWALHLDSESVKAQVAKNEEREAKKAEAKAARDAEREEKKKLAAANAAATLEG